MGLPMAKERRLSNRKKLSGLLPGRIQTKDHLDLKCQPVNVSTHGLGFISDKELDGGQTLYLVLKDFRLELMVSWCQPDFGKKEKFRVGVVVVDQSKDLEKIFLETGCLI